MSKSARERIDKVAKELYTLGATEEQLKEFGHAIAALLFSKVIDGTLLDD